MSASEQSGRTTAPMPQDSQLTRTLVTFDAAVHKFELAASGLQKGGTAVGLSFGCACFLAVLNAVMWVAFDKMWLNGWQFLGLVLILCATLLLYFALVFDRTAKIAGELSKERKI